MKIKQPYHVTYIKINICNYFSIKVSKLTFISYNYIIMTSVIILGCFEE